MDLEKTLSDISARLDSLDARLTELTDAVDRVIRLVLMNRVIDELGGFPAARDGTRETEAAAEQGNGIGVNEELALRKACARLNIAIGSAEDVKVEGGYGGRYNVAFSYADFRYFVEVNLRYDLISVRSTEEIDGR